MSFFSPVHQTQTAKAERKKTEKNKVSRKGRRKRRSRGGRRSLQTGSEAGTRKMLRQTVMRSRTGGETGEATLTSQSGGVSTHLRQGSMHVRVHEGAGENSAQKKGNITRIEGKRTLKADREKGTEPERMTREREKRGIKRIETGTEMRGVRGGGCK